MFRLFQDTATNKLAIGTLIEALDLNKSEKNKKTIDLLTAAREFLTSTEPFFQQQRELHISKEAMLALLDNAVTSLQQFSETMKKDKESEAVFEYCIHIYKDRLESLKDKHDAIYDFYETNSHPLKAFIKSNDHSLSK
jgi:hypothetical protein